MNELTLGPYKVGERPNSVIYSSFDEDTGKRRPLYGYNAAVVLRKPNARFYQLAARIIDYDEGDIQFDWPFNALDMAGNWDMEWWLDNGSHRFCSATFSFRVARAGPVANIVGGLPDDVIDGGSPSDPNAFDGGAP